MLNILISFLMAICPTVTTEGQIYVEEIQPEQKKIVITKEVIEEVINQIAYTDSIEDVDSELFTALGSNQTDVRLLSMITFTEANLESNYGQQLVTIVILNRIRCGFGKNLEEVIFAENQFCGTKLDSFGEYNGNNLKNVLTALANVKYNNINVEESELLFFNNPKYVDTEKYCKENKLEVVITVGEHIFLKRKE